ncbi:MAG: glycogen-binding domain-containing protein [Victivallaceae bacterium]
MPSTKSAAKSSKSVLTKTAKASTEKNPTAKSAAAPVAEKKVAPVQAEKKPAVKKVAKVAAATFKASAEKKPAVKAKKAVTKKTSGKSKRVKFKIQSTPGSRVFLAGDFNEWNNLLHELLDHNGSGVYQIEIELAPGVYEYKFQIDDGWFIDTENPHFKQNLFGTLNSVIIID